jgi:restriction system protein
MVQSTKNHPPTKQIGAKVIYEALKVLQEAGGELPGKEVTEQVAKRLTFTPWETERYEKTGNIRWQSILHFYTIDCMKAGFLRKQNGVWTITEEGERALQLSPPQLLENASAGYRAWKGQNKGQESEEQPGDTTNKSQKATIDLLKDQALEGFREHIAKMNPYDFQDLVAALLRAMSYYTPFVSPKGKDGGIDIIAYQDPLGAKTPRIKVQVKHKPHETIAANDIRSLTGTLSKDGDVGLFVTSGRFSPDAEAHARTSHMHVRLIDFEGFIKLWQDFYEKMDDTDKNRLPLERICFLGVNE